MAKYIGYAGPGRTASWHWEHIPSDCSGINYMLLHALDNTAAVVILCQPSLCFSRQRAILLIEPCRVTTDTRDHIFDAVGSDLALCFGPSMPIVKKEIASRGYPMTVGGDNV